MIPNRQDLDTISPGMNIEQDIREGSTEKYHTHRQRLVLDLQRNSAKSAM